MLTGCTITFKDCSLRNGPVKVAELPQHSENTKIQVNVWNIRMDGLVDKIEVDYKDEMAAVD